MEGKELELLSRGYCRKVAESKYLPYELINLIKTFFGDGMMHWTVTINEFNKLLSNKHQSLKLDPLYIIKIPNISHKNEPVEHKFQLVLYMTNYEESNHDCDPDIKFQILNRSYCTRLLIYYELHCIETCTVFKGTKIMKDFRGCASWPQWTFTLNDIKYKKLQQLTFKCYIDIIGYYHRPNHNNFYKLCWNKNKIRYEWNVNKREYLHFRYNPDDKFLFSERFGGDSEYAKNWLMYIERSKSGEFNDKIKLKLRILRMNELNIVDTHSYPDYDAWYGRGCRKRDRGKYDCWMTKKYDNVTFKYELVIILNGNKVIVSNGVCKYLTTKKESEIYPSCDAYGNLDKYFKLDIFDSMKVMIDINVIEWHRNKCITNPRHFPCLCYKSLF